MRNKRETDHLSQSLNRNAGIMASIFLLSPAHFQLSAKYRSTVGAGTAAKECSVWDEWPVAPSVWVFPHSAPVP